jgi:hypothetical protein
VKVLNGSGVPGAAKRAGDLLQGEDFRVQSLGNAARYDYAGTTIQYTRGLEDFARRAAKQLGVSRATLQSVPATRKTADLVVVLGSDFAPREGPLPDAPPSHPRKAGNR